MQRVDRLCKPDPRSGRLLEHRRRTWDSVGVRASRDILLTGVGVFSPLGMITRRNPARCVKLAADRLGNDTVVSVDARQLEGDLDKAPAPIDVDTALESEDDPGGRSITIFARVKIKRLI